MYTARSLPDPFTYEKLEVNYPEIILKNLKKYESEPKRKEVVTDGMFEYIDEIASCSSDDSLASAFKDWAAWSRYSGPRRAEWCQTRMTIYDTPENGPDEASAIRIDDIQCFDDRGRLVTPENASFRQVAYIAVRWRFQKNGNNGEIIKYYKDPYNKKWCPCRALWNIYRRAIRLGIPSHEPIAKYKDEEGNVYFITDKDVSTILQDAARVKLNIKDAKVLSKWTTHSLRVTAANELHRLGFSDAFIRQRLRWKSDAFMRYLRHTIHVARSHTQAMSLASVNLRFERSNLEEVNKAMSKIPVYRTPGTENDILWREHFFAATAAASA